MTRPTRTIFIPDPDAYARRAEARRLNESPKPSNDQPRKRPTLSINWGKGK